ncbi:MAG: class I SAM-dependent methyltransferase [Pseudomonadota bacterium]
MPKNLGQERLGCRSRLTLGGGGSALNNFDPSISVPDDERGSSYRSLDYYTGERSDIAGLMPHGVKSVLEVGCGAGGTGRLLREMGIEVLIGIEINPMPADLGGTHYTKLLVGDAETLDLSCIQPESLDCLLYPDVLEHFRDPWQALRNHLVLLRPGGYVMASIPNVRYYKAVRDLVFKGQWEYADAGIFDRGHLRFFTWSSIEKLFENCGLDIVRVQEKVRGPYLLKLLNILALNRLRGFLVKQYLVVGRKS